MLFSSPQGTFSSTDHLLGHKTSFNEFKSTEIIHKIIFCHKRLKSDMNNREKWKIHKCVENNILSNNWSNKKSQQIFKNS